MNKIFKIAFTVLLLIGTISFGQVKIGNSNDTHPKALLEIESNGKGLLLPRVEKISDLPNYNPSAPDLYDNNPDDSGMLVYVIEENELMKYDGYKWLRANEKSILNYKNISVIASASADVVVANILGITQRPILKFNVLKNIDNNIVNNLDLEVDSEGSVVIKKDGYYRLNPSVKTKSAGGLSVGNSATILSLQALYKNNAEGGWKKIHENSYLLAGLVVTAGTGNSVNSFSIVKYFRVGDKIRLKAGIQADGLTVGTGVTFLMSDQDTFFYIEKLD